MARVYKVAGPTSNKKAEPVVEVKAKTTKKTPEDPDKPVKTPEK